MNKKSGPIDPLFFWTFRLECVTDFHIDAAVEGVVVNGTGAQEEAGREREGLHFET